MFATGGSLGRRPGHELFGRPVADFERGHAGRVQRLGRGLVDADVARLLEHVRHRGTPGAKALDGVLERRDEVHVTEAHQLPS